MDSFPAGFPLSGLTIVVAGEGEAADAKARLFDGSPARLVRLVPQQAGEAARYTGARLAFIAMAEPHAAAAAARTAGALVNVVDRPELCDFTTPAIVDRGRVVGAVLTGGAAPVLAAELRRELEAAWPPGLGAVAELLAALRAEVRTAWPGAAERRAGLRSLLQGEAAALARAGDMAAALQAARAMLAAGPSGRGRRLHLAPPACADLISLRALRTLSAADRLVLAGGVEADLLGMARRDAPIHALHDVGPGLFAPGETLVFIGRREDFAAFEPLEDLPVAD